MAQVACLGSRQTIQANLGECSCNKLAEAQYANALCIHTCRVAVNGSSFSCSWSRLATSPSTKLAASSSKPAASSGADCAAGSAAVALPDSALMLLDSLALLVALAPCIACKSASTCCSILFAGVLPTDTANCCCCSCGVCLAVAGASVATELEALAAVDVSCMASSAVPCLLCDRCLRHARAAALVQSA